MNHRERVIKALNHEEPDRCPMHISFTPEFAERLKQELNLNEEQGYNPHGTKNSYTLERAIDQDVLVTTVGWATSYNKAEDNYTDEWGVRWKSAKYSTPYGTGRYTEVVGNPLAEDSAIDSYTPPDPARDELYEPGENLLRDFKDEYYIIGAVVTTIFESAWALRGLDRLLMDFALNPELAERILDIPYQYHLYAAKRLTEMGVDMIRLGDDVGGQNGMLISPEHWRKFLKPKMARLISEIKAINPDVKVGYHSDGNIYPIIPELIEIGLDVLNPIQPACMDPEEVKKRFGDKLCYWGTIDEQYTLPFGKPEDVREEVIKRLTTIGRGGGLLIGPTHHVQLDTPMENFLALIETVKDTSYKMLAVG